MPVIRKWFTILILSIAPKSWADEATCKILIEDNKAQLNNRLGAFTLEHTFHNEGRKHFDLPGSNYSCTLAFYSLKQGTMISCGYNKDGGVTFFQSDRTAVKEGKVLVNNLSFRHNSAQFYIHTTCE